MSEEEKLNMANTEKGLSALRKALEANNVKVDAQTLKNAVEEAHKSIVADCKSCANGWHW